MASRDRDDNAVRHAGVFALYDWCWGGDDQWLYEVTADRRLHSHDHGWYLPETGPDWTEEALRRRMDEPHVPQYPSQGLDAGEVARLAAALDDVSSADLRAVLQTVPAAWPVTGRELAALGSFLQRRAAAVAQRLRRGEVQP